ncbi:flavodoxin [Planctomycetales bacterium]|nr:flavodoxin [Planctomycetales bacterium]
MSTKRSLGALPLLYPEPTLLIATYDETGKPNVMTAAWGGICSSKPVSLAVSLQPVRWTLKAIQQRKAFTVNIPSAGQVAEMDFVGIVSGKQHDKFTAAGLTAVKAEKIDAPFIAECPVILECSLSQTVELGMHTMLIGEILDVKADENCLDATGSYPDIQKVSPIIFDAGSKNYYGIGQLLGKGWNIGKKFLKQE